MQVFQLLVFAFGFIEVPDFQLFVLDDVIEKVFRVDVVLVDFIEILGHLRGLTAENAEVAGLFLVQLRVDVDEFENEVDIVHEGHLTPLSDSLLYGKHLRKPNRLVAVLLEFRTEIERCPFVRENHGKFLMGKVVVVLDVARKP